MQHTIPWFQWRRQWEIVLLVQFRTTRTTPIRGSSLSNFRWVGCRRYTAASRHEVLLDEDDFRSFLQALELGGVLLLLQLRVTVLVLWKQFCAPLSLIHQYGSHHTCWVCAFIMFLLTKNVAIKLGTFLDFLSSHHIRVSPYLIIGIGFWFDSLDVFAASSDFWIQFIHPIIFERNRWRWSRWHKNFLEYDSFRFHHNHFRDTISWECIAKDDCVTSCLIELQSFPLSKLFIDPVHRILMPFQLLLARCKTWFGQIKLYWILMILMHGIHGCKKYRLSFPARSWSSRYQSWICDGV